jgi:putative Holliday junction resolvase
VRVLALDVGSKRIGVAASDPSGTVARPVTVVQRRSRRADLEAIAALVRAEASQLVVVGLPLSLSGSEGPQAGVVRHFMAALSAVLSVPLATWDERYTTVEATAVLREQGVRPERIKERVDAVAAALILQEYLDTTRRRASE